MSEHLKEGYAKIVKAINKQFRVSTIGSNGEPLNVSETFPSKRNAIKNIIASMNVCKGKSIIVHDKTIRNASKQIYVLCNDGSRMDI